jgi:hypothetical protein
MPSNEGRINPGGNARVMWRLVAFGCFLRPSGAGSFPACDPRHAPRAEFLAASRPTRDLSSDGLEGYLPPHLTRSAFSTFSDTIVAATQTPRK